MYKRQSYTIGADEKTPEGGIYKTALPTDAKSICIDIEGRYAISDPLTEGAEASTFNKYDEAVYTYPEGDATAAVKTAFGAENLTDVVTEDARLRMLEIYETEEDRCV